MEKPESPTIDSLPPEVRIMICNCLLDMSSTPRSFGYTSPSQDRPTRTEDGEDKEYPQLRTHAMILVSQTLSAEYRQAYYERTTFFFRVDSSNAFRTLPQLATGSPTTSSHSSATSVSLSGSLPNFWNAPEALIRSLRHCTIYIEIGDIACAPSSAHSAASAVHAVESPADGRRAMMNYSSFEEFKAADAPFDSALLSAVLTLLTSMEQLRSVYVVWNTSTPLRISPRLVPTRTANWTWDLLGKTVADMLRKRAEARGNLREWRICVGNQYGDIGLRVKRGKDGRWIEQAGDL